MRLIDIRLAREGDRVALIGRIEPAGRPVTEVVFRYPAAYAPAGEPGADPFLAALLVPALVAGEPLVLERPVSPRLLRRTATVQDILSGGVGTFFSGGVDSCYTLVKSRLGLPSAADPITHLIFVKDSTRRWRRPRGWRLPRRGCARSRGGTTAHSLWWRPTSAMSSRRPGPRCITVRR
jgi:hypothetical protein